MKEASAAGVPILALLLFAGIEAIASRTWAVVFCVVSGLAFFTWCIWMCWPKPDERATIRRILDEHPEFKCPMCGERGTHKRTCEITKG